MQRTKVKGTGARQPSSPDTEPDFYSLPFVYEKGNSFAAQVSLASPRAEPETSAQRKETKHASSPFLANYSGHENSFKGADTMSSFTSPCGNYTGAQVASFPSLLRPNSLADSARRAIMSRMIANSTEMQRLRALRADGGLAGSRCPDLLYGALSHQQRGPLHLNSNNMACDCAMPAF